MVEAVMAMGEPGQHYLNGAFATEAVKNGVTVCGGIFFLQTWSPEIDFLWVPYTQTNKNNEGCVVSADLLEGSDSGFESVFMYADPPS